MWVLVASEVVSTAGYWLCSYSNGLVIVQFIVRGTCPISL